eukprot:scaffold68796_cov32-Tisochrysis_lutea.AAC.2
MKTRQICGSELMIVLTITRIPRTRLSARSGLSMRNRRSTLTAPAPPVPVAVRICEMIPLATTTKSSQFQASPK